MNQKKYVRLPVISFLFSIFFFCCALFTACGEKTQKTHEKVKLWMTSQGSEIKVLVTTAHVGSIVKEVGGNEVSVLELIQGESDPHSYQLVKGDDEKFTRADVVFYSGLGLEHSPSIVAKLKEAHAIAFGDSIASQDPRAAVYLGGAIDPHMWMDVSLWARGCFVVAEKLAHVRPEKRAFFEENAQKLYEKLMNLDKRVLDLLQSIPLEKRYLVTTHDAFHYFTRRYLAPREETSDMRWTDRCRAPEGLAPDSQISTQDIVEIADYICKRGVKVLFAEMGINQDSLFKLQEVVREKGHAIHIVREKLYSDSMGEEGTIEGTYEGMIWHNAVGIQQGLSL